MAKEVVGLIKLQIQAGQAKPAPPVGPALGQRGVNIMDFCKKFNDKTKSLEGPIPVTIKVYKDKSFDFELKQPPVSYFILKAVGLKKGGKTPGRSVIKRITKAQVKEIAEKKMVDMNAFTIEQAMKQVEGSCRSMSIDVVK
jgi:large subunit ribosomal protein L11|tara:strand:- start:477 stop:899 length:423 start_codon:yes stop_codon:yes gene_type:complete